MGEAAHFGVVLDVPSIGVAKSRLVGREEEGKIWVNGKHVGWKVGSAYVSPGQRMTTDAALRIAKMFWNGGKQPLPLLLAHKTAVAKMREERERRGL
jgi:deoxyribonuclease V